jgi:hypothetical protein
MASRTDAFVIRAHIKNDRGYNQSLRVGVVAVDLEDAIKAFRVYYPDATLWTISHGGQIEIITSDAAGARRSDV